MTRQEAIRALVEAIDRPLPAAWTRVREFSQDES
jgi:hypothetical protein